MIDYLTIDLLVIANVQKKQGRNQDEDAADLGHDVLVGFLLRVGPVDDDVAAEDLDASGAEPALGQRRRLVRVVLEEAEASILSPVVGRAVNDHFGQASWASWSRPPGQAIQKAKSKPNKRLQEHRLRARAWYLRRYQSANRPPHKTQRRNREAKESETESQRNASGCHGTGKRGSLMVMLPEVRSRKKRQKSSEAKPKSGELAPSRFKSSKATETFGSEMWREGGVKVDFVIVSPIGSRRKNGKHFGWPPKQKVGPARSFLRLFSSTRGGPFGQCFH